MEPLRWVLLLLGAVLIGLVFAHSRGLLPTVAGIRERLRGLRPAPDPEEVDAEPEPAGPPDPPPKKVSLPENSRVVAVRILPSGEQQFPAEGLILALRAAGLRHGDFKIFHRFSDDEQSRIRYSVASLVEPGSFDLSNLADSEYKGISIFMVLPAPEDGVNLFDEMLETARDIAKRVDGRLVDEQGGTLSVQRERYMREEVMEFLRLRRQSEAQQQELAS
jgi:cell division protein ZipA